MQCASPDAIARLPATKLKHDAAKLWIEYFKNQKHGSLKDYLVYCLGNNTDTESDGSLVQVSFLTLNKVIFSTELMRVGYRAGVSKQGDPFKFKLSITY